MNRTVHHSPVYLLLLLGTLLCLVASCQRIPVGYLQTENAEFVPNPMRVYYTPDPFTPRATNGAPWVSNRIQGVSGTNPVNYSFAGVTASEGGDASAFLKIVDQGELDVNGGVVRLSQKGTKLLPLGSYTISLKVYNEGQSALLKDILTIVVANEEADAPLP